MNLVDVSATVLRDAQDREMTTLSAQLFATQEAAEGMTAFAQRRPPSWLGSC